MKREKEKLLVLIGPTAVGKTQLSLRLAKHLDCEIISGDSMQVYRHMDIGTAKASAAERELIPHHMIDLYEPDYFFSAAEFQETVASLIKEISSRGRLPFIVGGTGLYIQSVLESYRFSRTGADDSFRDKWSQYAREHGNEAVLDKLRGVDPITAERLHPNDLRRIIRALEIYEQTGRPFSEQSAKETDDPPYCHLIIGLTMERSLLYQRINERVDMMIEEGLLEEVANLLKMGFGPELNAMQALGYKEMAGVLEGKYSLEEGIERLKQGTRRFAKRQLSWFRRMKDIHWFDVTDPKQASEQFAEMIRLVAGKFDLHEE